MDRKSHVHFMGIGGSGMAPIAVIAKKSGFQELMCKYLQKDKFLVTVAGTHGKSTITVLTRLALEAGSLDPIVEAGTIYKPWGGGF